MIKKEEELKSANKLKAPLAFILIGLCFLVTLATTYAFIVIVRRNKGNIIDIDIADTILVDDSYFIYNQKQDDGSYLEINTKGTTVSDVITMGLYEVNITQNPVIEVSNRMTNAIYVVELSFSYSGIFSVSVENDVTLSNVENPLSKIVEIDSALETYSDSDLTTYHSAMAVLESNPVASTIYKKNLSGVYYYDYYDTSFNIVEGAKYSLYINIAYNDNNVGEMLLHNTSITGINSSVASVNSDIVIDIMDHSVV